MGAVIRGTLTAVRPATEADVDMLVAWHADPEVARFWDGETFTREEMRERLARREVDPYVVERDGAPIGYVQAWRSDDGGGGLDMFLVPNARGAGAGPDAARALATYLRHEDGWTRVTVDPYVWNDAAIRAWERAGFVTVERRPPDDEHTSSWLLMVFDGQRGASGERRA
ncbi:MAG: acetyltransferase [Actinobacteria bacterium]|nr:MAG: acetyltransferase [Actinomycetota bacterium]